MYSDIYAYTIVTFFYLNQINRIKKNIVINMYHSCFSLITCDMQAPDHIYPDIIEFLSRNDDI